MVKGKGWNSGCECITVAESTNAIETCKDFTPPSIWSRTGFTDTTNFAMLIETRTLVLFDGFIVTMLRWELDFSDQISFSTAVSYRSRKHLVLIVEERSRVYSTTASATKAIHLRPFSTLYGSSDGSVDGQKRRSKSYYTTACARKGPIVCQMLVCSACACAPF